MDRAEVRGLHLIVLDLSPSSPEATKVFEHWSFVLTCYKNSLPNMTSQQALEMLAVFISHDNFILISGSDTYEAAMNSLKEAFIKKPNEVVARHRLLTRQQQPAETIEDFIRSPPPNSGVQLC